LALPARSPLSSRQGSRRAPISGIPLSGVAENRQPVVLGGSIADLTGNIPASN